MGPNRAPARTPAAELVHSERAPFEPPPRRFLILRVGPKDASRTETTPGTGGGLVARSEAARLRDKRASPTPRRPLLYGTSTGRDGRRRRRSRNRQRKRACAGQRSTRSELVRSERLGRCYL